MFKQSLVFILMVFVMVAFNKREASPEIVQMDVKLDKENLYIVGPRGSDSFVTANLLDKNGNDIGQFICSADISTDPKDSVNYVILHSFSLADKFKFSNHEQCLNFLNSLKAESNTDLKLDTKKLEVSSFANG